MAMSDDKLYIGNVDGRLFALTSRPQAGLGNQADQFPKELTVGFTGAPIVVKDKVIIGAPGRRVAWAWSDLRRQCQDRRGKFGEFLTVAGTPESEKTWGNESWRTGGGGGWMPGTYDARPIRCVGRPIRPRSTTGAERIQDRRARGRATTFTRRR